MPHISVIASSSAGNAYAIHAGSSILLLELGVEWKRILRAIDYRVADVAGAIVSHAHGDHLRRPALAAAQLHGIPVHGPDGIDGVNPLPPRQPFAIGPFAVVPLPVPHNAPCYAYRIALPGDCGDILFATDCADVPYHARGISHLMIEANYSPAVLERNLASGAPLRSHPEHHLSADRAAAVARRHRPLRTILCIHLSQSNSDPDAILAAMRPYADECAIAAPGVSIPLSRYDF